MKMSVRQIPIHRSRLPRSAARVGVLLALALCASPCVAATRSAAAAKALSKHVTGAGYAMAIPAGWRVTRDAGCLRIDAPDKRAIEEYTLSACAFDAPLDTVASDQLFFDRDERGVWMRTAGMSQPSEVDRITGDGWTGLSTVQTCGISDEETGFHAAGGECLMAVVSDGKRSLTFDTVGFAQDFGLLDRIVASTRFVPAAGAPVAPDSSKKRSATGNGFARRCGWFDNPTPGNAWLTDRDGEWTIGTQGGPQPIGDWSPAFTRRGDFVANNGSYGHGCACMTVRVDAPAMRIVEVRDTAVRPLAACRADRSLPSRDKD